MKSALPGDRIPTPSVDVTELVYPSYDPHPVLQFHPEGRVTWANRAARELAAAHGLRELADLLPQAVLSRATATRAAHMEGHVGERIFRWALVREPRESLVFAYGVEVTDLARCELQLQHAQKLELLGELSASVAHDFNNYLTGIMGELEFALRRETAESERKELIEHAVRACGHAARMVRTLLDFSQQREMHFEVIEVDRVISSALPLLRHWLGKRVAFEHRPALAPVEIEADPIALEQILGNLAANARDAMPQGGRFVIATRLVEISTEAAAARPGARRGAFAEVEVSDTGSGIDAATVGRIFEPFFTTKPAGRGTGLGLACVSELVEKHRGWIEVESQPGAGTKFRLYFPATLGLTHVASA